MTMTVKGRAERWAEYEKMANGRFHGTDKSVPYDTRPNVAQMANRRLCGMDKSIPYGYARAERYGLIAERINPFPTIFDRMWHEWRADGYGEVANREMGDKRMIYTAANKSNVGGKRKLSDIKYIVVHYTANRGDTARNNAEYFKNNTVKASAHYFVDENETVQSVKDDYVAYSVGGGKYAKSKGGSFYKICTNENSISVELCDSAEYVSEKTAERAAELIRELTKKYNVPLCRVIRHYDVTGKICPKPFIESEVWGKFKQRIEGVNMEELNLLKKRVEELEKEHAVYNYIDENMPKWIRDITEWALAKGIISGTGGGLGMTKAKAENLVMIRNALGE